MIILGGLGWNAGTGEMSEAEGIEHVEIACGGSCAAADVWDV